MRRISQAVASFSRSIRIFLRDKAVIGSSMLSPLFFLIVLPLMLFRDAPAEVMPLIHSYLVIGMCTFLIMITAMSNLPGSIAADRDHDLYSKISSMPVNPLFECVGRIITVLAFSALGTLIITAIGLALGAQFILSTVDILLIIAIGSLVTLSASGIGLIIASLVKSESAAAHVGIAIVMVNYFIGIAFPYGDLPVVLRPLARFNPLPLGNSMMTTVALGEDFVGFNPLNLLDGAFFVGITAVLFLLGMYLYSRYCWRR
jgi:ABC-type multidrug transport system permease subunit